MNLTERVMAGFGPEDREHYAAIEYCKQQGWPAFHVANEMFTKSPMIKERNRLLGVSAGVPDIFVIINGTLVVVEMKQSGKSSLSASQRVWLIRLQQAGIKTAVCRGFDDFKVFVNCIAAETASIVTNSDDAAAALVYGLSKPRNTAKVVKHKKLSVTPEDMLPF